MRCCQSLIIALILLVMVILPVSAAPWEFRGGTDIVEKEATVTGDLFFSGDTLEIEGNVRGDLIVFARELAVRGRVDGSILGLVTEKLVVDGEVAGNIRVFAGNLAINGKVGRTVSAYAVRLETGKAALISGGVLGSFGEVKATGSIDGPVDVKVYYRNEIGGRINSNLISRGVPIRWLTPAQINGRVDEYSGVAAQPAVPQEVQIAKGYHWHRLKSESPLIYKLLLLVSVVWFLGSLLLSLIFYRIFPRTAWTMARPTVENLQRSLLVGVITFIGVPILIIILLLTTVGLPLAIVLLLLYLALLIFSGVPFSILLGRIIFRQYQTANPTHPNLLVVTGCLLASLLSALPLVGFVLPTCLGMGMIVRRIKPEYNELQLNVED